MKVFKLVYGEDMMITSDFVLTKVTESDNLEQALDKLKKDGCEVELIAEKED